jgi:hypothetical protein
MNNMEDQAPLNAEIVDIVTAISDNKRAAAIDAIQDILYSRAADAMSSYKQVVANTFFDEPVEVETNETDNGNN